MAAAVGQPCFLLIVPCGIETWKRQNWQKDKDILLIVPCGIETYFSVVFAFLACFLLIVPCGIETPSHQGTVAAQTAF